jgi:diamine N-acetyltransferase
MKKVLIYSINNFGIFFSKNYLKQIEEDFEIDSCDNVNEYRNFLKNNNYDLIITEIISNDNVFNELLLELKKQETSVIFLAGYPKEYVTKLSEIGTYLQYPLEKESTISTLKKMPEHTIILESLSEKHLLDVMSWINDKDSLYYFANMQNQINPAEELEYMKKMINSKNDYVFSMYLLDKEGNKTYIGQTSINQIYWGARNGRLFIFIKKEFRLMGLGPDCIKAIEHKAFDELKLHKLWLILRSNNKAYQGYEAMGYTIEGKLIDEYYVQNRFYDMMRLFKINPNEQKITN